MSEKKYSIEDICELTGYSRRTVRYYVQEGLLEPPAGRGRGGFYFDSHVDRLRHIRALQDEGLKLADIQSVLNRGIEPEPAPLREIWLRYPIEAGIELHISKDLDERERKRLGEVIRVVRSMLKGGQDDDIS